MFPRMDLPGAIARSIARSVAVSLSVAGVVAPWSARGQAGPATAGEVRQFVTFRFAPGRGAEALALYRDSLLPVYRDLEPLRRFRLYREVESPVPLDVIVESTYDGVRGMEAGNAALRRPHRSGTSARRLYGAISALSLAHTDEFVAMRPRPTAAPPPAGATLTVLESLRLVPGGGKRFEALLADAIEPWEASHAAGRRTETGRYLVSDGWDYLRIHEVASLAEVEALRGAERVAPFADALAALVAARRVIVVRRDGGYDVR